MADASQAKSAEEVVAFVEELKRQWMATIDAMVDPLIIVRTDYTIAKANQAMARMASLPVRQVLGGKCYEIFANRSSPCKNCRMLQAAESGKPETFTLDNVRTDRFFEVSSQPIFDPSGKLEGLVHVYRDRTEAKSLQEKLMQNEKLASIGLLAGGVAHEINNPLGGILVFSQMVLREMPKDSPFYSDIVEIEAATQRCKAIVENLLDFARQRTVGSKQPVLKDVDVVEAAQTALRLARVTRESQMIDIEERWQAANTTIVGERNKLMQLFLNLIQNAFQAMPDGGVLILSSHNETRDGVPLAVFEIEDTGIGIPPEHLQKIFDPFFTTKEPGEGTGLGLAICYGIVKDLHGELEVESEVNKGTRFRLRLPLAEAQRELSAS